MKTILKIFSALLIGALSVGFVSCGSDDDEPNASLLEQMQGNWTLNQAQITFPNGKVQTLDYQQIEAMGSFHELNLRINSDKINGHKIIVTGNTFVYQDVADYSGITVYVSFANDRMIFEYDGVGVNEGSHIKYLYARN